MEILFLAHRLPFPPDRGDRIRSFNVLKRLARLGRVHLACFADDEVEAAQLAGLRAMLGSRLGSAHVEVRRVGRMHAAARALLTGKPLSLTMFDSPAMRHFVAAQVAERSTGAVYVFSGQMAQFVPAGQPFVMDFVDVDSAKFAAYAEQGSLLARPIYAREAARLASFEKQVAARADTCLFVSETEASLFRRSAGVENVRAISNGIDSAHFDPAGDFAPLPADQSGEGPLLLFTGQMDYRPNIDAVRWFVAHVLPRIPAARFVIAGRNPTAEVARLRGDRVTVTGAVSDMRSWLAAANVVVAPLRIARGIQNKVLEAMAMARPVVASTAAFEGIEARPGRDLIVADGAEAMAAQIVALLADPSRGTALGSAARSLVIRSYSWEARLAPLDALVRARCQAASRRSAANTDLPAPVLADVAG